MARTVLHVLSQRPSRTGSGVTLDSVVRCAGAAGWRQAALVGVPADGMAPRIGDLATENVHHVTFAPESIAQGSPAPDLPFAVPGMSDVMPYPSSVWSRLGQREIAAYRRVWRERLRSVVAAVRPDLIHAHHVWLLSSLLRDAAPDLPVVVTCHATGLRQMSLCPHLRDEVVAGCRRIDRFCVLHEDHRAALAAALGIPAGTISVVGAGFRDELFRPAVPPANDPRRLVYVGKYSRAKGLHCLLDAFARLAGARPDLELHVAGDGSGDEADELRRRMADMAPRVVMHGNLDQPALAVLLGTCGVCVLPSFYEGMPLVLVEAAACGCRVVATALPGVVGRLAPALGPRLRTVPLPRLAGIDTPVAEDLPPFTDALADALKGAVAAAAGPGEAPPELSAFTWSAVFARVEAIWRELLADRA